MKLNEVKNPSINADRICGIYKVTNIKNNKVYIGQSIDIQTRWNEHKNNPFNKNHFVDYDCAFYRAIRKYGRENFECEIIYSIPKGLYDVDALRGVLNEKEIKYIKEYHSFVDEVDASGKRVNKGYNSTLGGGGCRKLDLNLYKDKLIKLHDEGNSLYVIYKETGISEPLLSQFYKAEGIPLIKDNSERDKEICTLRLRGYTYSEICEEMNIDKPTVQRVLKKADLVIPVSEADYEYKRYPISQKALQYKKEIIKDFQSSMSLRKIEAKYNIGRNSISQLLRDEGIDTTIRKPGYAGVNKAIFQINPDTNKVIAFYPSITEAAIALNLKSSTPISTMINQASDKIKTVGGYEFTDSPSAEQLQGSCFEEYTGILLNNFYSQYKISEDGLTEEQKNEYKQKAMDIITKDFQSAKLASEICNGLNSLLEEINEELAQSRTFRAEMDTELQEFFDQYRSPSEEIEIY